MLFKNEAGKENIRFQTAKQAFNELKKIIESNEINFETLTFVDINRFAVLFGTT